MYQYKQISQFSIFFIIIILTLSIAFAIEPISKEGNLLNIQRETTEFITQTNADAAFTSIGLTFARTIQIIPYKIQETDTITSPISPIEKPYRYFTSTIDTETDGITEVELQFQVSRDNEHNLNPTNVAIYGFTKENIWEKLVHEISFSSGTHYHFSAKTSYYKTFAIAHKDPSSVQENQIVTSQQPILENSTVETIQTQTAPVVQNSPSRTYIDDANKPNIFTIVVILIIIVILIIGAVAYVVANHKVQPTDIQTLDNKGLGEKVKELVEKGKSDGEIIDSLLDEDYSLDSVIAELQKFGRMK